MVEAASGEAVLRECVGRRLPDLVLQVHAGTAHNEHGMDTSIMARANHWLTYLVVPLALPQF